MVNLIEHIYTWLVRCGYSNMTYEIRGPKKTNANGVLTSKSSIEILEVLNDSLNVYTLKNWLMTHKELSKECVTYTSSNTLFKLTTQHLTIECSLIHHMMKNIFILISGLHDDVSFLEAFLIDNILDGGKINICYIIM